MQNDTLLEKIVNKTKAEADATVRAKSKAFKSVQLASSFNNLCIGISNDMFVKILGLFDFPGWASNRL